MPVADELKKQFKRRLNSRRERRARQFAAGNRKLPAAANSGLRSRFQFNGFDFIHVAPSPGFTGLDGSDQGVLAPVEVLGGVFIFRRIAASDVSAFETHPQVKPGVPDFYAVLADVLVRLGKLDLIQMRAFQRHSSSRNLSIAWDDPLPDRSAAIPSMTVTLAEVSESDQGKSTLAPVLTVFGPERYASHPSP